MGRKRAAFAEGIAEEEQQYAQVLRDIRDLRGETQQELGRLLGWSVSTVSRFEAAAERPDQATHRRYCTLAPTEELRERAAAAYEALSAPPERHAAALAGGGPALAGLREKVPTGALTTVELDVERWRDLDHGTGTATILVTPRSLESGPEK